jgi:uncharacterized protein (TIGR01777 family)
MTPRRFVRRSRISAPAEAVYRWHARPGALERLSPPWESVTIEERTGGIEEGSRVLLRVGVGPVSARWVAVHRDHVPGVQFCDQQVQGPFARWIHTHRFRPDGPDASILEDDIEYALPLEPLAGLIGGPMVDRKLRRLFAYRHAVTRSDIEGHAMTAQAGSRVVAVSGSHGLVGSALVPFLTTGGHRVVRLVREAAADAVRWDPATGLQDPAGLVGVDAVVHLAGENIAARRWTDAQKDAIRRSRVEGTRRLCEALAALPRPPRVLVAASATGFYGDRGDERLTEESAAGTGFLAEVCREWEAATEPAERAGIRVVHLRFGMILSPRGGALAKMLVPFKLGAGGPMGSGRQFVSWIAIDDAIGAVLHALVTDDLRGPVNAVAPSPVTNAEFTRRLARVLRRPALVRLPAFAARLAFGEMADALLLASARVVPARLQSAGYRFRFVDLEATLRHLLGLGEGKDN